MKTVVWCLWTCIFKHIIWTPGLSLYSLALLLIYLCWNVVLWPCWLFVGECCWINKINFSIDNENGEKTAESWKHEERFCFVLVRDLFYLFKSKLFWLLLRMSDLICWNCAAANDDKLIIQFSIYKWIFLQNVLEHFLFFSFINE